MQIWFYKLFHRLLDAAGVPERPQIGGWNSSLIARFMGPTWGHLGPTEPMWAPCWPHELCSLACFHVQIKLNLNSTNLHICNDCICTNTLVDNLFFRFLSSNKWDETQIRFHLHAIIWKFIYSFWSFFMSCPSCPFLLAWISCKPSTDK